MKFIYLQLKERETPEIKGLFSIRWSNSLDSDYSFLSTGKPPLCPFRRNKKNG